MALFMAGPLPGTNVSAASTANFQAGNIIDDALFFDKNSMNVAQIQEFLNSQVPTCYNWHSQDGYSQAPPYTCLKQYQENPTTLANNYGKFNSDGSPAAISGGQTAAQIIYNTAQKYGISPKVLLVLLEKEQILVRDSWPLYTQFQKATGYACPDIAPCDTKYYGFYNQVESAAWQFTRYAANPSYYGYRPYVTRYISYNPTASCGGSDVYIHNQATANLYNYTPYQPNSGALSAGYGTAYCGAYGNRNFYLFYSDWFGSTHANNGNVILSQGLKTSSTNGDIFMGETLTASYEVANTANYDMAVGGLGICGRMNGKWYDFGYKDQTIIPAKSSVRVSYSKKVDLEGGALSLSICSFHSSLGGWVGQFYPWDTSGNLARSASLQVFSNPRVTSSVGVNAPSQLYAGDNITIKTELRNNGPAPIYAGDLVFAVRDSNGANYDFPGVENVIIPANSTLPIERSRTFDKGGTYSFFLASHRYGQWSTVYPQSDNTSIKTDGALVLKDNPVMTSSVQLDKPSPAVGSQTTATFKIANNSSNPIYLGHLLVAARDASGTNVDFPSDLNVTIPAKSTYTYKKSRSFTKPGSYTGFFASYNDRTNKWGFNEPLASDSTITRKINYQVRETPSLVSGISLSPSRSLAGQPATATFTIKNESDAPIYVGSVFVAARDPYGNNIDFPAEEDLTIPANSTYTYSKSRILYATGKYSFFFANYHRNNDSWHMGYPRSVDGSVQRSIQREVVSNPVVVSNLSVIEGGKVGSQTTVAIDVRNDGDSPTSVGTFMVAARDPQGRNVDFPAEPAFEIPPHSTRRFTSSRTFTAPGKYTFFTATYNGGIWYRNTYPASVDSSIIREISYPIQ